MDDPFDDPKAMHVDVEAALKWQAARSPEEVIRERESIMMEIENAGSIMWKTGRCARWLDGCDDHVKQVHMCGLCF